MFTDSSWLFGTFWLKLRLEAFCEFLTTMIKCFTMIDMSRRNHPANQKNVWLSRVTPPITIVCPWHLWSLVDLHLFRKPCGHSSSQKRMNFLAKFGRDGLEPVLAIQTRLTSASAMNDDDWLDVTSLLPCNGARHLHQQTNASPLFTTASHKQFGSSSTAKTALPFTGSSVTYPLRSCSV